MTGMISRGFVIRTPPPAGRFVVVTRLDRVWAVYDDGRVWDLKTGHWANSYTDKWGYRRIGDVKIHRLILIAFVGIPKQGKCQVRHLNGDPSDNRLSTLAKGQDAPSIPSGGVRNQHSERASYEAG